MTRAKGIARRMKMIRPAAFPRIKKRLKIKIQFLFIAMGRL
jgi:hypothetical protein